MAAVKWEDISGYINEAFEITGRVLRGDVLALAERDGASDDIIDALDAIGSRAFNSPADVRAFLVDQGYVVKQ